MNKSLVTNLLCIVLIIVGLFSPIFGYEIKTMGLYGLSGAVTNWLAIHMLFEKVPFLYGSGVITERFEEFKDGIRNLIMKQFFTEENFKRFAKDSSSSLNLDEDAIIGAIDFDPIFIKLKSAIVESPFGGMLNMFGGEQALEPLRPQFKAKFEEAIREMISDEKFVETIVSSGSATDGGMNSKILLIVEERLNELTPIAVKEIIQEMIREHLGWLVVWGGVFGCLIGLVTTLI